MNLKKNDLIMKRLLYFNPVKYLIGIRNFSVLKVTFVALLTIFASAANATNDVQSVNQQRKTVT